MAIDFTKWRVEQMRSELLKLGMKKPDIEALKGKAALAEKILELRDKLNIQTNTEPDPVAEDEEIEDASFDEASFDDSDSDDEDNEVEVQLDEEPLDVPKLGSPEWQDYVIGHLTLDEYEEKGGRKFPKAVGLRRVAQVLLGPIVNSGPTQIWPPMAGFASATVCYNISILWTYGSNIGNWISEDELLKMGIVKRDFQEVADANKENTPHPFDKHLCATASSRAEGRALRKALQLNVVTAEEVSAVTDDTVNAEPSKSDPDNESLTTAQQAIITNVAERLKLDIEKTLQFHGMPSTLASLTRSQASKVVQLLNKYQSNGNESIPIPDFIKVIS